MKINNVGFNRVNPYQQTNKVNASQSIKMSADKIEISSAAKEMQEASRIAGERAERVEQLKIQVQNGTYKVNPQAVAQSMVDFYKK